MCEEWRDIRPSTAACTRTGSNNCCLVLSLGCAYTTRPLSYRGRYSIDRHLSGRVFFGSLRRQWTSLSLWIGSLREKPKRLKKKKRWESGNHRCRRQTKASQAAGRHVRNCFHTKQTPTIIQSFCIHLIDYNYSLQLTTAITNDPHLGERPSRLWKKKKRWYLLLCRSIYSSPANALPANKEGRKKNVMLLVHIHTNNDFLDPPI